MRFSKVRPYLQISMFEVVNKVSVQEIQKCAESSFVDGVSNFVSYSYDRPVCFGAKKQLHLLILLERWFQWDIVPMFYCIRNWFWTLKLQSAFIQVAANCFYSENFFSKTHSKPIFAFWTRQQYIGENISKQFSFQII